MHPVKRIVGHVYFAYALLVFVLSMLVVFIPIYITTLFPEPRRTKMLHPLFKLWMGFFMPVVFCPVLRKGRKRFKKGQNYVVVCNHNSFADVPVTSPWIPGANKTLAKVEMARVPIFGVIYKSGSVLVDRKSEGSRRESFAQMQKMLDYGLHLCLYPEGTRNKTKEPMQAFFDGAFVTAIKAQKPIMPAVIFNTKRIFPGKPKAWAWPMPVRFHFLEPIETEGLKSTDTAMLKEKVRKVMLDYFVANQNKMA